MDVMNKLKPFRFEIAKCGTYFNYRVYIRIFNTGLTIFINNVLILRVYKNGKCIYKSKLKARKVF